jgi:hypothetical protein
MAGMFALFHPQDHLVEPQISARVLTPETAGFPKHPAFTPFNPLISPDVKAERPPSKIVLPGGSVVYRLRAAPPRIEVAEPPANRLIELIKTHYPAFEQTQPLPDHVRRAMRMVQQCHTAALGGHVERCPDGHISRIFYNSCGHRWCPRCAGRQRREWLFERRAKLLPVRHYHVVFTISHRFNDLWRANPRIMGDLLFHSATDALHAFLADPKWLGAEPGITITLETWDDRLFFHPHLHGLVTGGGLTPEGEWRDVPNPHCLVAVTPLMWEFRKRFCRAVKQALEQHELTLPQGTTTRQWLNRLNRANRQNWEVFIAKTGDDGGPSNDEILRYQADDVAGGPLSALRLDPLVADLSTTQVGYLKAPPLSEKRLNEAEDGRVSFQWGAYNPDTGMRERDQRETLPVAEFLRRYLQHIPPANYQTVRHYGLYASAKTAAYARCCELLADRQPPSGESADEPADDETWIEQHTCPVCGKALVVTGYIPSSVTGRCIPRVPIGHVFAPCSSLGGGHDP